MSPTASKTSRRRTKKSPFYGFWYICKKEITQILRERRSLYFPFIFAAVQALMIGYGVNTNIRQIRTVVYDLSHTQDSRQLIQQFINTDEFQIIKMVNNDEELHDCLVSSEARVAIKIPADYSRRLLEKSTATISVMVDGATLSITNTASSTANAVMLQNSIQQAITNSDDSTRLEARRNILFNPDSNTANFTIPGIIAVLVQGILIGMVYITIVRERDMGTLEQLYMTPVQPLAVITGKITPYFVMGFLAQTEIVVMAIFVFDVPFRGSYLLMQLLTVPFLLSCLGIGMMISVRSRNMREGGQWLQVINIASVMISGYTYDIDGMPYILQLISRLLPVSYYLEITRGIMVRGAQFHHLWFSALFLSVMGIGLVLYSAWEFQRQARRVAA